MIVTRKPVGRGISVSKLKAQLSAALRDVQENGPLTVMDRDTPVAILSPMPADDNGIVIAQAADKRYEYKPLRPLMKTDVMKILEEDRADRW